MAASFYDQILRVNLAGERGARSIYAGQLWILRQRHSPLTASVAYMDQQEAQHVLIFEQLARRYQVRPTILHPLWIAAGWSLGTLTALMGDSAAMACTEAVEEVIADHYQQQKISLDPETDAELIDILHACQNDEQEHRQEAINHGSHNAPYWLFSAIRLATKTAIFLSKRY